MNLPLWSKYDAQMYRALNLFPEDQEGIFLDNDEFRSYFKVFHGRPVQDIVEALDHYSPMGYFNYEIKLAAKYLKQGQALSQVETALHALQSEPESSPAAHHGLSKPVHTKVMAERPLTKVEASNLPDKAKNYLEFTLSDVDRPRLREELAIYNDNSLIQPSRLIKSTHKETNEYTARVAMDDSERRVVCISVTGSGDYPVAKLQVERAPYDFMHYLFRPENSNRAVTIKEVQKNIASCRGRSSLTALVDDCGFNKALKDIFFKPISSDKVHFSHKKKINRLQLEAIKKLSAKFGSKK